jgi:MtN3 and saliva related transmembrane protein
MLLRIHQPSAARMRIRLQDILYRYRPGISPAPAPRDGNPMNPVDSIGYLAATLTTLAFIPQVLHTWRLRSAGGISVGMYVVFTIGITLWLLYGVLLGAWPIILANAITLALALSILVMAIRYR